jgi:HlyD family secretion protein
VTGASADQVTNFIVKVRINPESYAALIKPNSSNPSPFRPGLSATIDIHTDKVNSLAVPIQSVTTREDNTRVKKDLPPSSAANTDNKPKPDEPVKEYVFVYANGKVRQVQITTGIQDDMYIQVLSGLKAGQEVVSRPFTAISKTLKDSMEVQKVDKEKLFQAEGK